MRRQLGRRGVAALSNPAIGDVIDAGTCLRFDARFRRRCEWLDAVLETFDRCFAGWIEFLFRCRSDVTQVLQIEFEGRQFRVMCDKTSLALKGSGGCV